MLKRALVVLTVVLAAAVAASAGRAADSPPTNYTDPAGDNGTAPDIGGVTITNDATGQYTFRVALNTAYSDQAVFYLYLDTDKNASTGDPANLGADYVLVDDHASHSFYLGKWDGSQWGDTAHDTASFAVSGDLHTLTASVNQSEIGDSSSFNFFLVSTNAAGTSTDYDDAPSGSGSWSYTRQLPLTLTGTTHAVLARKQHAWGVVMMVTRSDTGATVGSDGALACSGTEGGARLKPSSKGFVSPGGGSDSVAYCQFVLPKKKHVKLSARITVTLDGASVTKTVALRS